MELRQKDSTNYPIVFLMVDNTDHLTGKTGLTPTVTLSKNSGAFGAAVAAVTEIGNGLYALVGNATDRNTLGTLMLHASATGADPSDVNISIVDYDPFTQPVVTDPLSVTLPGTYSGNQAGYLLYILSKIISNKLVTDPTSGIMTVYDDAGNVLLTAQLYENVSGTQKYRGKGAERREKLS